MVMANQDGGEQVEPERIGRYRIIEQLGQGGFATVYLCEDRGLDDRVAVKLLAENHSQDPESVGRFVSEARVMRNLRTPGVVAVHDVGEHGGRPYFVMEYCERGTLSDRLRNLRRRITLEEAVGLATAISSAMVGLHGSEPPVVHRDIKPDNLLIRRASGPRRDPVGDVLQPDEELIVGDFGLAKVVDVQSTKMSLIAYTRGFAPPEQVRGQAAIQPSADVYSASAVLIAAISGAAPEQVFADGEAAFTETALAATGPLRPALEQGIRFTAEHRQPTAMAWADALIAASNAAPAGPAGLSGAVPPSNQTIQVQAPTSIPSDPPGPWPAPVQAEPSSAADLGNLPPPGIQPPGVQSPGAQVSGPPPIGAQALGGQAPGGQVSGVHPVSAPPIGAQASDGQAVSSRAGRSKAKTLIAVVGVLALVIAGASALLVRAQSSDAIIGPASIAVGQEAAYAVTGAEVAAWEVGGQRTEEPVLLLTPSSAGRVTIRAFTADGEETRTVDVRATTDELQIVGPGHIPLGETVELSATGNSGAALTWRVAGEDYQLQTLEIRPREAGIFEVEVSTEAGATGRRSFTVADQSG